MIEELHIFGVYMPAALTWCILAVVLTFLLRGLLQRIPLHHVLWHPALLEMALFFLIWLALVWTGDHFLRGWIT